MVKRSLILSVIALMTAFIFYPCVGFAGQDDYRIVIRSDSNPLIRTFADSSVRLSFLSVIPFDGPDNQIIAATAGGVNYHFHITADGRLRTAAMVLDPYGRSRDWILGTPIDHPELATRADTLANSYRVGPHWPNLRNFLLAVQMLINDVRNGRVSNENRAQTVCLLDLVASSHRRTTSRCAQKASKREAKEKYKRNKENQRAENMAFLDAPRRELTLTPPNAPQIVPTPVVIVEPTLTVGPSLHPPVEEPLSDEATENSPRDTDVVEGDREFVDAVEAPVMPEPEQEFFDVLATEFTTPLALDAVLVLPSTQTGWFAWLARLAPSATTTRAATMALFLFALNNNIVGVAGGCG